MNNFPLVSFVIPTHNRSNVIIDCLESVVKQSYPNVEVVVVNDNSTDETVKILHDYSKQYDFFKYFENEGIGVSSARNTGIKKAIGEYIAFMDDDDICELSRVEEQMRHILESNFDYDFIISSFKVVDKQEKVLRVNDYLKNTTSIGFTVRWLIKKNLLLKAGLFDEEQPNLEEVELFFRLKNISKIYFSKTTVVIVRQSKVSLTKNNEKMIRGIKRLLTLHSSQMNEFEKSSWNISLCKKYLLQRNEIEFKEHYKKIIYCRHMTLKPLLLIGYLFNSKLFIKIFNEINLSIEKYTSKKNTTYIN